MNMYMNEVILLLKCYNKKLTDDDFLEKFKLEKIRYRREVLEIALSKEEWKNKQFRSKMSMGSK